MLLSTLKQWFIIVIINSIYSHYAVTKGSYTFHVDLCGKAQGCTGSGTSVCRTGGSSGELSLGTTTSRLILIDCKIVQCTCVYSSM